MPSMISFENLTTIWSSSCRLVIIFSYGFQLFLLEWLYLIWIAHLLLPLCLIAIIAWLLVAYLLPFPTLLGKIALKKKEDHFLSFFQRSFISLFYTRSITMKMILSDFIFVSYSLKLLANEIDFLVYKFCTRKIMEQCRTILLLFTLVEGFEKASLWYIFMIFSRP